MPWNVGAKGAAGAMYLRSVASSSWRPWLRDNRRGAGVAAAGELEKKGTEKKQAATVFTGEEENASGVGVARTRKWASEQLGRPVFPSSK